MPKPDETHDPALRSWIDSANEPGGDFPIQNLPFGVFTRLDSDEGPRIGVAIGDGILDVAGCVKGELLEGIGPETACALCADSLNQFMSLGRSAWSSARGALSRLLAAETATLRDNADVRERLVVAPDAARLHLPAVIGDYTDFYASIHHATNVGSMFRPDNPLMPNYKHLPVGYHGRASSIVTSGTPIRRPFGQTRADDSDRPAYGASALLDYELELGFFVGSGNELGHPVAMSAARDHIFGMVILNDWSARDVQKWEYQPLGPFNAKNFATSISPWVVTLEALDPYRVPGPRRGDDDPPLLDYLTPTEDLGYDITVEAYLISPQMREPDSARDNSGGGGGEVMLVSRGTFADMYWTIGQMLAHHTSTGCNLRPGDLLASGTVSGASRESAGCLLERTWRGQNPIRLPDGTARRFLLDGDEVVIRAYGEKEGAARIGFGECRGVIVG